MNELSDATGRDAPPAPTDGLLTLRGARRLAAPSWVVPAPLADNCRFLAGRVDEVGLLFFDTRASLGYDETDLPPGLARLPLAYHAHLPLDLPWHDPARSADMCRALMERCAFLAGAAAPSVTEGAPPGRPGLRAVLHPPDRRRGDDRRLVTSFLRRYAARGGEPALLLLENTPENDLGALEEVILAEGLGVCLDLGHLLACGQEGLLARQRLLERARMLHLSAPGTGGGRIRHLPLTALDRKGRETGRRLCLDAPRDAVLMVELFSWVQIEQSLPVLRSWLLPEG